MEVPCYRGLVARTRVKTVRLDEGRFLEVPTLVVDVIKGPDERGAQAEQSELVTVGTADGNTLTLTDDAVSRYHLELVGLDEGVRVIDHGSTNGTWFAGARIEQAVVPIGAVLDVGRSRLQIGVGRRSVVHLHAGAAFGELLGGTPVMRRLMARLKKASSSDVSALLIGESGTGKELAARALHERGVRAKGPFITVDCAALVPTLVSSELFGHERGAFTGAERRHLGAFERANGGTLFLDEVGELSSELQAQLLGVLERRSLRRLGGEEDIAVDVRVVSATNRDLRVDVNAGSFRLDLYYRLAVVCFHVPPLRERSDDLGLLVEHFVEQAGYQGQVDAVVPPQVMAELRAHHWPGNVRELRNVVEASIAMGEVPDLADSPMASARDAEVSPLLEGLVDLPYKQARASVLRTFELGYLQRLLQKAEGNVSRAAREASIDRSYLIELLRRHGLR